MSTKITNIRRRAENQPHFCPLCEWQVQRNSPDCLQNTSVCNTSSPKKLPLPVSLRGSIWVSITD